jgi:hypothetical protein
MADDAASASATPPVGTDAKPFQLGIEQKDFLAPPPPPVQNYPKPMMQQTPAYGSGQPMQGNVQQQGLNGGVQQGPPGNMQMMNPQSAVPQPGYLPPQFLGRWLVNGTRSKVEALPQYQGGMDSIFSMQTQNIWTIQGSQQQGYTLGSDQGVQTSLMVQTTGDTAVLRYQHPIHNTMAQEAVVMQLMPGGATFSGLERISIVKQGEPGPRAKVEYNLVGRRQ